MPAVSHSKITLRHNLSGLQSDRQCLTSLHSLPGQGTARNLRMRAEDLVVLKMIPAGAAILRASNQSRGLGATGASRTTFGWGTIESNPAAIAAHVCEHRSGRSVLSGPETGLVIQLAIGQLMDRSVISIHHDHRRHHSFTLHAISCRFIGHPTPHQISAVFW